MRFWGSVCCCRPALAAARQLCTGAGNLSLAHCILPSCPLTQTPNPKPHHHHHHHQAETGKKAGEEGEEEGSGGEGGGRRGAAARWGADARLDDLAADGPQALLGGEEPGFGYGGYAADPYGYGGPDGLDAYGAGFGEGGAYGLEGAGGAGGHFRDRTVAALRAAAEAEGRQLSGSDDEFDVETERCAVGVGAVKRGKRGYWCVAVRPV